MADLEKTAVFDDLQVMSFGGIPIAWDRIEIRSSLRKHVHEYRHTPGGQIEKQGRTLYTITVSGIFDTEIEPPAYNDGIVNYPDALIAARMKYENETTDDLVIPTVGTIKACITEWTQTADVRVRSGERVTLVFLEDQADRFLPDGIAETLTSSSLKSTAETLIESITNPAPDAPVNDDGLAIKPELEGIPGTNGFFSQLNNAINSVLAIRDTGDMYSNLVAGKIEGIALLCREMDRTWAGFEDPRNWPILQALKNVWWAAEQLAGNVRDSVESPIKTYRVPHRMTITEVSTAVYGRTDFGFDILGLNVVEDAFDIRAGTALRYYADLQRAA